MANPFQTMTDTEYEVLELVISRAVEHGIKEGLRQWRADVCLPNVERTLKLEDSVFGTQQQTGLDERVNNLEKFEKRVVRLTWLVAAQFIATVGAVAFYLITAAANNAS
jgi:hypothetical protein